MREHHQQTLRHFAYFQVVTVEPGGHTRDHSRKYRLLLVGLRGHTRRVQCARVVSCEQITMLTRLTKPLHCRTKEAQGWRCLCANSVCIHRETCSEAAVEAGRSSSGTLSVMRTLC